jgi:hypothetical protein
MFGKLTAMATDMAKAEIQKKLNPQQPPQQPQQPQQQSSQSVTSIDVEGEEPMQLSNCNGTKKALLIGINYIGQKGQLNGCINDVKNIRAFIMQHYAFPAANMVVLTDDQQDPRFQPTKQNILNAMGWLVKDAQPGDSLFFHYSGHGGQEKDEDGDEVDGFDETIYPLDHERAGMISDDHIHNVLVQPLPRGVRLTSIFDSCHSGSVMDLPYLYKCDGEIEAIAQDHKHLKFAMALLGAGVTYKMGNTRAAMNMLKEGVGLLMNKGNALAQKKAEETKSSMADVIQFSGCKDSQTSADANIGGQSTGAMSHALVQVLSQNPHPNYTELLFGLRNILKDGYSQVPQMSSGRPMDMNSPFTM